MRYPPLRYPPRAYTSRERLLGDPDDSYWYPPPPSQPSITALPSIVEPTSQPKRRQRRITSILRQKRIISILRDKRIISTLKWVFLEQWFLVGLGLVIFIASRVQVPAENQATKQTVITYLCVSIIFFITGCTLSTRTLIENYSRWKLHLFVQAQCSLMTSALTFGVVCAAGSQMDWMSPSLLIGLLFMGCVPTAISSNVVMTRQAHGNTALTVVQSTIGNVLGPFVTPALMSMYTSHEAWYTKFLDKESGAVTNIYGRVFKQLGVSVFLPMVLGQILHNVFPNATKKVFTKWKLSKLASASLLLILWQTYDQAFISEAFTSVPASNMVFIVCVSPVLFALWIVIACLTSIMWLPRKDVTAVCYTAPAKTSSLGVPLANAMYLGLSAQQGSQIQIPLVIFQGLQILVGSLLTVLFKRWIAAGERRDEENLLKEKYHRGYADLPEEESEEEAEY